MKNVDSVNGTLTCVVNIEWFNSQGLVQRKLTQKNAILKLVRNEFREILLELHNEKIMVSKFQLKDFTVRKKFMNEGKASISFTNPKCVVFISNAPPSQLFNFLRTMFVKTTNKENGPKMPLRKQLLLGKTNASEEISPVTLMDINKAKKKVEGFETTPSPPSNKRRRSYDKNDKIPAAKKLYTETSIVNNISDINNEQKEVLNACLSGKNIFFTGSAGTGKSYLLRKIISMLPPDITIATASTGVAACHIGGVTLHSFAGIGSGEAALQKCFELASRPVVSAVWKKCKHLIIDEISMIDGLFFEKIEKVARYVRKNDKPFGGIQLILCGDFLQLPPVVKSSNNFSKKTDMKFCFQTTAWEKCINFSYNLKQVHRQKDKEFIDILNSIRIGQVTSEISQKLIATALQKIERNGILATRLCSHMQDANLINEKRLSMLEGDVKIFTAQDSDVSALNQLDQQTPVSKKIELKIGAQVMLLKNISVNENLVNGARGVVIGFKENLPVVKFKSGKEYLAKHEKWTIKTINNGVITRKQIPLRLAWAFSIHKSQGLTLDCVEISLGRVFEAGQAYVALSRAQSLDSLRVLDFNAKHVWSNKDVLKFYRNLECIIPRKIS